MNVLKGSDLERALEGWLWQTGWLVHRAAPISYRDRATGAPRQRSEDVFGAFDLLAARRAPAPGPSIIDGFAPVTWAIQATTRANRSSRRAKVLEVAHRLPLCWRVSVAWHEVEGAVGRFHFEDLRLRLLGADGAIIGDKRELWHAGESVVVRAGELERARREARPPKRPRRRRENPGEATYETRAAGAGMPPWGDDGGIP